MKLYNIIPIFCLLMISNLAKSQAIIKNYLTNQEYENYSKSIDIFQEVINNSSDSITFIVLPNNDLERLGSEKFNAVFEAKVDSDINQYVLNFSSNKIYTEASIVDLGSKNQEQNPIIMKSGKMIYVEKSGDSFLISDHFKPELVTSEALITKYLIIGGRMSFIFLFSAIKY